MMIPSKLEEIALCPAKPLACLQVNPPSGSSLEYIFSRLQGNLQSVDFFNVTDSARAKMRMSPFALAAIMKQHFGVEPLVKDCTDSAGAVQ
jgi:hypothetical protein